MQTTFDNLSPSLATLLAELTQKIAGAIQPEKILCYGYRASPYNDWSCFTEGSDNQETIKATFDLLVITNNSKNDLPDHEILQKINHLAEPLDCETIAIVQSLDAVNDLIAKNSRFLTTLYHKAVLVYNAGNNDIITPPAAPSHEETKSRIETVWNNCYQTAERFYKTACFCLDNDWNEKALFDLHQATQHTCMALLRVYTGYRSTTHNLFRLLSLIENFSFVPSSIFPCITAEEIALLNLLNKAYSDARYKENYSVPTETAILLKKRVQQLLLLAQELYDKKITALQSNRTTTFPLTATDATI
jgi:HEPN domain-containing protein